MQPLKTNVRATLSCLLRIYLSYGVLIWTMEKGNFRICGALVNLSERFKGLFVLFLKLSGSLKAFQNNF